MAVVLWRRSFFLLCLNVQEEKTPSLPWKKPSNTVLYSQTEQSPAYSVASTRSK